MMSRGAREQARREKSRWFITCDLRGVKKRGARGLRARSLPQPTDFKPVSGFDCLTLLKTGTYTHSMPHRRLLATAATAAALIGFFTTVGAQSNQRSMYV